MTPTDCLDRLKRVYPFELLDELGSRPKNTSTGMSCLAVYRGEKNPSVSWYRNSSGEWRFRDHGSNESGTIIDFVALVLEMRFRPALEWVAARFGGSSGPGWANKAAPVSKKVEPGSRTTVKARKEEVKAVKTEEKDSAPPPWEREVARTHDYPDGLTKVVFDDGLAPKCLWKRECGKWGRGGVNPGLYCPGKQGGETLFVAEGEKDAEALAECGFWSVSPPDGAGTRWNPEWSDSLRPAKTIILCGDNDKAGSKFNARLSNELPKALKSASIFLLDLCAAHKETGKEGLAPKGFDVSDLISATGHDWFQSIYANFLQEVAEANDSERQSKSATPPSEGLFLNDTGNARRLSARMLGKIGWMQVDRTWYCRGENGIWRPGEEAASMEAMQIQDDLRAEAKECDDSDIANAISRFAKKSGDRAAISNMLALCKNLPGMQVEESKDAFLVGTQSGLLDLSRRELWKETPDQTILTKSLGCRYDPEARCPRWLQFLDEVFLGDSKVIQYVRSAVGYSLAGKSTEHCLFFLYGFGGNGKSTFCGTLLDLFGSYGMKAPQSLFLPRKNDQSSNDIARLVGKRFALGSETTSGSLDEATIKDITGGDTLTARFLHCEFFDFKPTHTLWICGNHKPSVRGNDEGFWRRIRLIPFLASFSGEAADPDLPMKLNWELPGILNWALDGFDSWQDQGLQLPGAVKDATAEYRQEEDLLGVFISQECDTTDPLAKTPLKEIFKAYKAWTEEEGMRFAVTRNRLGRSLLERGFDRATLTGGARGYAGIRVIHEYGS